MTTEMQVQEIGPGLWRWTAPHPEWRPGKDKPGGWGRMVGSVFHRPEGASAAVLIDPQLPPEGSEDAARFWTILDRDLERAPVPLAVILGNHYHERSARPLYDRYRFGRGASVWISHNAIGRVQAPITRPFRDGEPLPSGVAAHAVTGLADTEVAFHLPAHRALVFADAVLGAGDGRLRVAPESWADAGPEAAERYRREFRPALRRLAELDVDLILPSHGEPVLRDGRRALLEALESPAWGEG